MTKFSFVATLFLVGGLSQSASAISITNVTAPTLLLRPPDGALYSFSFAISVTIGPGDFGGGFLPINFTETVLNTTLDGIDLKVPPMVPAGTKAMGIYQMRVGCNGASQVFGPLNTFNNDALTAVLRFPTLMTDSGNIKVECLDPGGKGKAENKDVKDITPPEPPYDPFRKDLRPLPLFSHREPEDVTIVPEPGSLSLMALGVGLLSTYGLRRFRT